MASRSAGIPTAPEGLAARQWFVLVGYGALLWFLAALLVREIAPLGALAGGARMLTYALVIPGTLPAVLLGRWLAGLARDQVAAGVSVMTATALLLDGVAVAWFPWLYGAAPALVLAGAAVILWGAGVGLVIGFALQARGR